MSDQPEREDNADTPKPLFGPVRANVSRIGYATLNTGDSVPLVRVTIWNEGLMTIFDLTGPDAIGVAGLLREAAGGLTIATTIEGDTP